MPTKRKPTGRVVAVQELRRSSAAQPHTHRRPRGIDRRDAIADQRRGD